MYCKIVDGQIVSPPQAVPTTTAEVSNLSTAPDDIKVQFGWYPVVSDSLPVIDPLTQRIVSSLTIEGDTVRQSFTVENVSSQEAAENLAQAKREAIAFINQKAGETRQKYMTDIPGQESTYLLKEEEVKRYLDDPEPDMVDYPLIAAEAAACNWTVEFTVNYIRQTAVMFRQVAAAVEGRRRGGIIAVENAVNLSQIEAAKDIIWP